MSGDLLMTFNAGSSTLKLGLFEVREGQASRIGKGMIDLRSSPLVLHLTEGPRVEDLTLKAAITEDLHEMLDETFALLAEHFHMAGVAAIGHRVVHGGDLFDGPVRIDDAAIAKIRELVDLAPLHQPQSLRLIEAVGRLRPVLAQSASFDTAFHRTASDLVRRFALPRAMHERGIKRYGFHGLSYASIAGSLRNRASDIADGRVVVAHLGSGASLCALHEGRSRDTSMSFTPLDGIPMATRCGALDPGVLLHLLGQEKRDLEAVQRMLYHEAGLLGVSGISADSRVLLESDRPEAAEALDLFTFRISGEVARLANTLGGLDALVFTAGIGEHQAPVRAAIARRLAWLGLDLDEERNTGNAAVISADGSRVRALVIPTDEEQVIADEAVSVLF
ncbi:acetate/propionate family kinase [Terrihabitans sp. B22-R8]|uniref:acetate/propionate family kinase n=1 Tax=Terrihabitans sp. B22-R8 TaxID=3425128 RepID=UPI00403CB6D4